jgi:hypothetical protein
MVTVAEVSFCARTWASSSEETSRAARAALMLSICFCPPRDHGVAKPRGKR